MEDLRKIRPVISYIIENFSEIFSKDLKPKPKPKIVPPAFLPLSGQHPSSLHPSYSDSSIPMVIAPPVVGPGDRNRMPSLVLDSSEMHNEHLTSRKLFSSGSFSHISNASFPAHNHHSQHGDSDGGSQIGSNGEVDSHSDVNKFIFAIDTSCTEWKVLQLIAHVFNVWWYLLVYISFFLWILSHVIFLDIRTISEE